MAGVLSELHLPPLEAAGTCEGGNCHHGTQRQPKRCWRGEFDDGLFPVAEQLKPLWRNNEVSN
jgi:hypothetical protein